MPPPSPQPARRRPSGRRRWPRRAALALLGLAVVDGLAWQAAQGELDRMLAHWSTQLRHQGWTIRPGQPTRGGSPLTARLTLQDPRLDGPVGNRTIAWGATSLTLSLSLLHPLTVRIGLDGTQAARLTGPYTAQAVRIQSENARLFIPLGLPPGAATGRAAWAARTLALQILQSDGRTTDLTLHDLHGHGLWNDHAGPDASRLALTASATAIDLPPTWPLPPAPTDAHRLSDAGLTLSLPGGADTPVLVQALHARWTHLSLSVTGNAHLSPAGGPEGTFTLSVAGIGHTVRTLDQAGTLSPDLARAVTALDRLAAGYPATAPAQPDTPALTDQPLSLPLHLSAGMFYIGALPLGHPMDWIR
ncbi:DUF2125 domain-containing protein [Gluconacetobacter takamatsuzukensis]|uniref:DUF2125 domain-containing protein n=1 Tax=Gluconacetobacter takamatsuzukensis TaxID=1286190 RepID=A0A7W4KB89_9PROT|nr:DUF2125 domain-containing protein [Gluconacetobacter takamatsuzukensis]MBB2203729.1 DUF2125 domain-containing protein [Gluconacetobacter takamatsuzukensis]